MHPLHFQPELRTFAPDGPTESFWTTVLGLRPRLLTCLSREDAACELPYTPAARPRESAPLHLCADVGNFADRIRWRRLPVGPELRRLWARLRPGGVGLPLTGPSFYTYSRLALEPVAQKLARQYRAWLDVPDTFHLLCADAAEARAALRRLEDLLLAEGLSLNGDKIGPPRGEGWPHPLSDLPRGRYMFFPRLYQRLLPLPFWRRQADRILADGRRGDRLRLLLFLNRYPNRDRPAAPAASDRLATNLYRSLA